MAYGEDEYERIVKRDMKHALENIRAERDALLAVARAAEKLVTHEWDCRTQMDAENFEDTALPTHPCCDCACKPIHEALSALPESLKAEIEKK